VHSFNVAMLRLIKYSARTEKCVLSPRAARKE